MHKWPPEESGHMTLRDFKIGWRLLVGQPAYSAVVLLGLSIGFAACFLLLCYVRYSFSYESSIPDAQRIYFVMDKANFDSNANWSESVPFPMLKVAQQSSAVELATPVVRRAYSFKADSRVLRLETLITQPSIEKMFGIHVLEGDLDQTLTDATKVALTQSSAQNLFGNDIAIGKLVQVGNDSLRVSAIIADPVQNSTVYYDALVGLDSPVWASIRHFIVDGWSFSSVKIYLKIKPGADLAALNRQLQHSVDASPLRSTVEPALLNKLGQLKILDIKLGRLSDAYFEQGTDNIQSRAARGDKDSVFEFAAMAGVILLLAATNYVNLATVRTLHRQREIALRKVLGASARRIVMQFMLESMLVAVIATGIGLLLAWLLLPVFSDYVGRRLEEQWTVTTALGAFLIGALVGMLAGAYPAWVALNVRAPQTFTGRGNNESIGGLWLRRVLTISQFATAMGLTGVTVAMFWQTHYAISVNPGFDTSQLWVIEMPKDMTDPASRALRDALQQVPGVSGVIASADPLGGGISGGETELVKSDGSRVPVQFRPVSANFFQILGIQPVAGRLFDSRVDRDDIAITEPNVIVINQATARALGYQNTEQAIGQIVVTNTWTVDNPRMESLRIVGIAPDLRLNSLHDLQTVQLAYLPFSMARVLTVKASSDSAAFQKAVTNLARRHFPNDVIDVRRTQSYLEENYSDDLRKARLIGIASLIALLIAAFGMYVLSAYSLQRLSRQIVLRKLFGARDWQIAAIVGREFAALICIGATIGLPVAAIMIQRYLATYSLPAPIGSWTLLVALLIAFAVTFISTLRHTLVAMRLAPAQILRE